MNFLLQIKKEEDTEVKEVLKQETFTMMRSLLELMTKEGESNGVDWLLIDTLKWIMASD